MSEKNKRTEEKLERLVVNKIYDLAKIHVSECNCLDGNFFCEIIREKCENETKNLLKEKELWNVNLGEVNNYVYNSFIDITLEKIHDSLKRERLRDKKTKSENKLRQFLEDYRKVANETKNDKCPHPSMERIASIQHQLIQVYGEYFIISKEFNKRIYRKVSSTYKNLEIEKIKRDHYQQTSKFWYKLFVLFSCLFLISFFAIILLLKSYI